MPDLFQHKKRYRHYSLSLYVLLGFLILISSSDSIVAQEPAERDTLSIVETTDGNTYIGSILSIQDTMVVLSTSLGILNIPKNKISSITTPKKDQMVEGEFWPENPHSSRHFWGPSGYGLRKGEGYYQNTWIWLNQASYGITDNFSIGGGLVPLFLFGATEILPVWLTPKINLPYRNGKGAFGFGTILFGLLGEEDVYAGILYGTNTFGTRDKQLTLGLGYGYSSDGGFASTPTISVSGMMRTSKKWAILTENYLISAGEQTTFGLISGGARYMGRRLAIDFGGIIPVGGFDFFVVIPWLGIAVPFK
ncbi:MAG: hypothetical protein KA479_13770 [Saprospiraceae bacterium]|nr:hypothetical protein [Saprospiraceae bacterium]